MGESSRRSIFPTLVLLAILVTLVVVGYLIIDAMNRMTEPIAGPINDAATQIQEIINPTPTIIADPITVIRQVQSLSRLETASYTIEKVITAESGEGAFGFLFSERLLLVAQGQVIAGVDLSLMTPEDVQVAGDAVFVTMPASEIFVATLDNEATYVYDRERGILSSYDVNLETLARQAAEREILLAALEDGILDMAQRNGQQYLESLLRGLGFQEVTFVTATPAPGQDRGEQP
jgi:hypothetical protein